MVKEPVRLKFSSVKAVVRSAMGNYQIHGAKVIINHEFHERAKRISRILSNSYLVRY